ncbi:MAG: hypothetical protein MRY32_06620 [Rickettsiales bacterium]|nr:hypothetical protein [Rickettsiales bacterium]
MKQTPQQKLQKAIEMLREINKDATEQTPILAVEHLLMELRNDIGAPQSMPVRKRVDETFGEYFKRKQGAKT